MTCGYLDKKKFDIDAHKLKYMITENCAPLQSLKGTTHKSTYHSIYPYECKRIFSTCIRILIRVFNIYTFHACIYIHIYIYIYVILDYFTYSKFTLMSRINSMYIYTNI